MTFFARFITTALIAALAFVAVPVTASANHDEAVSHTPYCAPTVGGGQDCGTWCYVPVGGGEPVCGEVTCAYQVGNPEPVCTASESTPKDEAEAEAPACETAAPTASEPAKVGAPKVGDAVKISRLRAKVQELRERLRSR